MHPCGVEQTRKSILVKEGIDLFVSLVQERLGSGRDELRNSLIRTFFTLARNGTFVVRSPFL